MAATVLEPNSSSPEIQAFQKRLAKMGFKVPTDGSFDSKTMDAVQQLAAKMGYTRSVDKVDAMFLKSLDAYEKQKFYTIKLNGQVYTVNEKEMADLRKRYGARAEKSAVARFAGLADEAMIYWKAHSDTKKDNWIIGSVIELYSGATLPSEGQMKAAVAAAENMRAKARALTLTQAEFNRDYATIQTAFKAMSDYRNKIYDGGDSLIKNLEIVRDGCVLFLEVSAAFATAGSSLGVQIAASAGTAGYSTMVNGVSKLNDPKVTAGTIATDMAVSMSTDAIAGLVLKGPKGKQVLDAVEKRALGEAPSLLRGYVVKTVKSGGEKMVEDGIKGMPKLVDGKQKITFEDVAKAGAESFITGAQLGPLGKVAEKYGGRAVAKYFKKESFANFFPKGMDLDKGGEAAVGKVIEKIAGKVAEEVLSGWDPKKDASKADAEIQKRILAHPLVQAEIKKQAKKK